MMTGMVPAHTGGTGVGLDETTTKQLLLDLDNSRTELEKLRAKLREAVESFGLTPEREAELRRISALLAANKLQRDLLTGQTGKVTPDKLQLELAAEKEARAALEQRLAAQQNELEATRHNLQEEKNRTFCARVENNYFHHIAYEYPSALCVYVGMVDTLKILRIQAPKTSAGSKISLIATRI